MQFTPTEAIVTNQLFLLSSSLILSGLLISNFWFFKHEDKALKPSIFWPLSIISMLLSFCCFFAMTVSPSLRLAIIPGVGFTLYSILFLTFSIKEIIDPVKKRTVISFIIAMLVSTIIFGYLRVFENFQIRTSFFVTNVLFLTGYSLNNIRIASKVADTILLKVLFYGTSIIFIFGAIRMATLWQFGLQDKNLEFDYVKDFISEPILSTSVRWLWTSIYIFSYFITSGLYLERLLLAKNKTELYLQENKKLLQEKHELMERFILANRVSEANALSASLSHELNQPLGALKLNIEYLNRNISTISSPNIDIGTTLREMLDDTNRSSQIVNSLKNIFTNKNSNTSNHNLQAAINSTLDICKARLQQRGINVETTITNNYQVHIHDIEMIQVFMNLINNSIDALSKLSKNDKWIRIVTKESGQFKHIIFSDNGAGISQEIEGKLFELMGTNKEDGAGIGLWLSKYIIEKNGGDIRYEKNAVGGATFVMSFPIKINLSYL